MAKEYLIPIWNAEGAMLLQINPDSICQIKCGTYGRRVSFISDCGPVDFYVNGLLPTDVRSYEVCDISAREQDGKSTYTVFMEPKDPGEPGEIVKFSVSRIELIPEDEFFAREVKYFVNSFTIGTGEDGSPTLDWIKLGAPDIHFEIVTQPGVKVSLEQITKISEHKISRIPVIVNYRTIEIGEIKFPY